MKDKLQQYREMIEDYLGSCFQSKEPQQRLFEAMRYSLLSGGKRLRPVMTLAFCELCGAEAQTALPFAAGIEMIQTYSLIHDDLPCMDDDDYRRGKPSCHKAYGEATAILAGDGLLTAAFGELCKAEIPGEQIAKAVRGLSYYAGELGMVGGQMLDMEAEQRQCTATEVYAIEERKTSALIRAACLLGVIAAGGSEAQEKAAVEYGLALGLAFQIRDDVLDVIGDAEKLGKATGADGDKNTFVRLYGVDSCLEMVQAETERAVNALRPFPHNDFLVDLARSLVRRDF